MQEIGGGASRVATFSAAELPPTPQHHRALALIEERIHHPPLPLICLVPLLAVIVAPVRTSASSMSPSTSTDAVPPAIAGSCCVLVWLSSPPALLRCLHSRTCCHHYPAPVVRAFLVFLGAARNFGRHAGSRAPQGGYACDYPWPAQRPAGQLETARARPCFCSPGCDGMILFEKKEQALPKWGTDGLGRCPCVCCLWLGRKD